MTKAKPTSKSIDIHIPDLDYKRIKCIKELTFADVSLYGRPTFIRADKSILVNKRDMLRTNLKCITSWDDLYDLDRLHIVVKPDVSNNKCRLNDAGF